MKVIDIIRELRAKGTKRCESSFIKIGDNFRYLIEFKNELRAGVKVTGPFNSSLCEIISITGLTELHSILPILKMNYGITGDNYEWV